MTSFKIPPGKALFVLAVAFLLLLFNGGSRFTIGLTLKPMADDLVWSRTTLSLTVTVFMVVSAVVLPVIGRLVDRYNPKVILAHAFRVSHTISVFSTPVCVFPRHSSVCGRSLRIH